MTNVFDLCAGCGHARIDHDGGPCETCQLDLELHYTFLTVPGTAHLEAQEPAPVVCGGFVEPRR